MVSIMVVAGCGVGDLRFLSCVWWCTSCVLGLRLLAAGGLVAGLICCRWVSFSGVVSDGVSVSFTVAMNYWL